VSRQQHGDQLLADRRLRRRGRALVTLEQGREHVAVAGAIGAAPIDVLLKGAVEGAAGGIEASHQQRVLAALVERRIGADHRHQIVDQGAEAIDLLLGDAEHDAQDDFLGDRQRRVLDAHGRAAVPRRRVAAGSGGDDGAVVADPIGAKGRLQLGALGEVLLAVDEQKRVAAEDRLEQGVAAAGVKDAGIAGEDEPNVIRVGDDHVSAEAGVAQREGVAESSRSLVEQCERPRQPLEGRVGGRELGPVGQRC
jgi:hypothetical protein